LTAAARGALRIIRPGQRNGRLSAELRNTLRWEASV